MNCFDFESTLDEFLSGELAAARRVSAMAHLNVCAECCQLTRIARGEFDRTPDGAVPDLVASVMERTGDDPCQKARNQLCDFVDAVISPNSSKMLVAHLQNCTHCSALFLALTEVASLLPELAEIRPDPAFVKETIALTSAPAEEPAEPSGMLRTLAQTLLQRRRFSWEAAYAGTLLMVTLMGGAPTWPAPAQTSTALASLKIDVHLPAQLEVATSRQWFIEGATRVRDQIEASHGFVKRRFEESLLYIDSEIEGISRNADKICRQSLRFGLPALGSAWRNPVRAEPGDESAEEPPSER